MVVRVVLVLPSWGLFFAILVLARSAIPGAAAPLESGPVVLSLILNHDEMDAAKAMGKIGGVHVVGRFDTTAGRLVVNPPGTKPRVAFLSGSLSCGNGGCTFDGKLLGQPAAGLVLHAKFKGNGRGNEKHDNGTLIRVTGSLAPLHSDRDAWMSAVTDWTGKFLVNPQIRARVLAQAADSADAQDTAETADGERPAGGTRAGGEGAGGGGAAGAGPGTHGSRK
jgi:hypothetical protein